jgi:hypothetical protein
VAEQHLRSAGLGHAHIHHFFMFYGTELHCCILLMRGFNEITKVKKKFLFKCKISCSEGSDYEDGPLLGFYA